MRSELKIGIAVGVVIVVGIIIFVVKRTPDENGQNNQVNMNQEKNRLPSPENVTRNPPNPIEPAPTNPPDVDQKETEQKEPPVDSIEVVIKKDDRTQPPPTPDKEIIPAVKEEPTKPVIVMPEPEVRKPRYHEVKSGENLYTISEQYYGQGNQTAGTKAIQKANPERIKDINVIKPGWRLRIPYPEDIVP